ncbi:MAG: porin family protein [Bacteroidales bacterium]|nr:porin family protein [Bacteroidales bacterium]MCF8403286.1 porin family protein [Bacteroidales bacterium]
MLLGKKFRIYIFSLLFCIPLVASAANPSRWSGEQKQTFWLNWKAGVGLGYSSYFGDLSRYDNNFIKKIQLESDLLGSFRLSKRINKSFSASGELMYGGFESDNNDQKAFKTRIFEYNLQLRWHLIKTITGNDNSPIGLDLYVGAGQFFFNSTQYSFMEGNEMKNIKSTDIPEFVFITGGSLSFKISRTIDLIADFAIRQAQNDKLDNLVKNDDYDYYSTVSIGLSYSIQNLLNPFENRRKGSAAGGLKLTQRR